MMPVFLTVLKITGIVLLSLLALLLLILLILLFVLLEGADIQPQAEGDAGKQDSEDDKQHVCYLAHPFLGVREFCIQRRLPHALQHQ